ncbi:hypothetical protein GCM10027594_00110 [Hymenobacter agri]|uniref:Abortive infection protein-like C-terminal domain-containing protein n=1 Tax=Hymenobacter jeollabukensis TaxID=2025313 RepID=A0A5R8WII7_9BACT|nr:hypothetical protein [Hymenobacter jeollabukensis]TLM88444.1 hypothetical protein FDY95_24080 [Hymenobacter jeollabukensis]
MLHFDNAWRFESPGSLHPQVSQEFLEIIGKLAQGKQQVYEHFKTYLASVSGTVASRSSNASWAYTDLQHAIDEAANNAPMCIEAFYSACQEFKDGPVLGHELINRILAKHGEPYQIKPPNLERLESGQPVTKPEVPLSLAQQAQDIIHASFAESQRLLAEGRYRPAVQEILWLLETVSTAFQGMSTSESETIQGKYFNKIVDELRKRNQGTALEQVIGWLKTLHGYLSAPAGGGIRHGMDLKEGVATSEGEAKLYCNLITSYTNFLLSEYQRLSSSSAKLD